MEFTRYGALAALALAVTLIVTGLAGRRRGLCYTAFISFAVLAIQMALLCSRAIYCLASSSYYTETVAQPQLMLQLQDGGYSMLGALLGLIAAALLVQGLWRDNGQKLAPGALTDSLALGLPLGLVIVRLAEPLCDMGRHDIGWGYDYTSPLFSFLDDLTARFEDFTGLHPVFLYEAIAALVIFVLLLVISRKVRGGDVLLCFLLFYGCTQAVMESLLNSGHMKVIHFVKINQVGALVLVLVPLIVWSVRACRSGHGRKVLTSWLLTVVCILSAVVQEFSVEGADNPYFSVVTVGYIMAALLACAIISWCAAWRKNGLLRILPPAIIAGVAIAAAIVDRTTDVGDHYRLVLWGIMACDMLLLAFTGLSLRKAADTNINQ